MRTPPYRRRRNGRVRVDRSWVLVLSVIGASVEHQSAVDRQRLPVDERRARREQPRDRLGDLARFPGTSEQREGFDALALARILERLVEHRGQGRPRGDAVDGDPVRRERVEALTLLGRSGEPREIAEAITWLLSPRSSFVDGETLTVDGGLMLD